MKSTITPDRDVGSSDSSAFVREPRYLVVKIKDANAYLTPHERATLERLWAKCAIGRIDNGKPSLECVVVESDWPEYEPTWRAIEARITGTAPNYDRLRYALEEAECTKNGARLADYADDIRALLPPNNLDETRA